MIKLNSQNINNFVRRTRGRLPQNLRKDISIKPIGKQKYIHLATPDMSGLPMDSYDIISGPVNAYNRKLAIKHIIDSPTSNLGEFADTTKDIGLPINISSGKTIKAEINQNDTDVLHSLDNNKLYDAFAPSSANNHYKPLTKKQLDSDMAKEFPYAKKLLNIKHNRAHHLSNKRPSWTTPSDITPNDIPNIDKIRAVVEKQAHEANQIAKRTSLKPHYNISHANGLHTKATGFNPNETPQETNEAVKIDDPQENPSIDTSHDNHDVKGSKNNVKYDINDNIAKENSKNTVFDPKHENLGKTTHNNNVPLKNRDDDPSVGNPYRPTLEEQGAVAPHNDPKINRQKIGSLNHSNEETSTPKGMNDASYHLPNINESFANSHHKGFGEHGANLHHFSHKQVDEANKRSQQSTVQVPKDSEVHLTTKDKKFGLNKAGKKVEMFRQRILRAKNEQHR